MRLLRTAAPWSTAGHSHETHKEIAMITNRTRVLVLIGTSLYVNAMAFAGGVAAERIRLDRERAAVLQRHEEAVQERHRFLIAAEQRKVDAESTAGDAGPVVR